jgi:anti-sigma factor RsiW
VKQLPCSGQWLLDFADERLAAEQRPRAEQHLAACPACRQELASLQCSGKLLQAYFATAAAHGSPARDVAQQPGRVWLAASTGLVAIATVVLAMVYLFPGHFSSVDRPPPPTLALAPVVPAIAQPTQAAPSAAEDVLAEVAREAQIARLRAACDILAREPGMSERHAALEKYLAESYGL